MQTRRANIQTAKYKHFVVLLKTVLTLSHTHRRLAASFPRSNPGEYSSCHLLSVTVDLLSISVWVLSLCSQEAAGLSCPPVSPNPAWKTLERPVLLDFSVCFSLTEQHFLKLDIVFFGMSLTGTVSNSKFGPWVQQVDRISNNIQRGRGLGKGQLLSCCLCVAAKPSNVHIYTKTDDWCFSAECGHLVLGCRLESAQ